MLKTVIAATAALTLISGAGFAQSFTDSTTKTTTGIATPMGDVGISRTTRTTGDNAHMVMEKDKTVRSDGMAETDKTVSKRTEVSPDGDVTHTKTKSTTIR